MPAVLLMYALFASVFTIAKVGLEYTQPFFFVGTRMILAGLILLAYQFCFHPKEFQLDKAKKWKIFGLAIFNIYLTNMFEFWGLKYLTSFKTCFIYSLCPFLSALFSFVIFSEKLSRKKWAGLFIGFAGLIPILTHQTLDEELTGHIWFLSWAEIAVMLAASCSVYGWIILRQLVKDEGCSATMANGASMLIGGALSLGHSYIMEPWNPVPVASNGMWPFLECTFLLIVISNLICYNLYGSLLKRYSATFLSFAGFTTPLFTALFGWLALGEVVSWPFYASLLGVFCGLFLFNQEELRKDVTTTAAAPGN